MTIKTNFSRDEIPRVELYNYDDGKPWMLNYGVARGYIRYPTERECWAELDGWLDNRIHTMIKELDALAQLKRKAQKKLTEK